MSTVLREMRVTFGKEQSDMLIYLRKHYEESGTNIVRKAVERLYRSVIAEKDKQL
jgi:hypothetical protein